MMSSNKSKQLYLLQNQDKYFLGKNNDWVDGRDLKELFKTPHRDIAVNQMFEVNAQDYTQRIHVLGCEVQGNNNPVIEPAVMPPPLPKAVSPKTGDRKNTEVSDGETGDEECPATDNQPELAMPQPHDGQPKETQVQEAQPPGEISSESGRTVEPQEELLVH